MDLYEVEFKDGVYLKPNGDLALVYSYKNDEGVSKFGVDTGKTKKHPIFRGSFPVCWESNSRKLGWGPSKFLHKCKFLGEL